MRFARPILLALSLLAPALAQDAADSQAAPRAKHEYQVRVYCPVRTFDPFWSRLTE